MGGADSYCSVSGARYFFNTNEFFDHLSSLDEALVYNPNPNDKPLWSDEDLQAMRESFSAGLRKYAQHLRYSEEDVESSSTFVLFCPREILEDGTMIKYTEFDDPRTYAISIVPHFRKKKAIPHRTLPDPTEYTESTITEILNVFPGDNPDLGDYEDIDGRSYSVLPCGNNLIITYTSYLILKQAAPDLKPHILYALAYGGNRDTMGEVAGIDYGPVARIFEQYAFWAGICETGGSEHPVRFWRELLCDKEPGYEDVVYDAWKGAGNMWVFVRPDRFPIPETLSSNPLPEFPHHPITPSPTLSLQSSSRRPSPTLTSLPPDILLSTCQFLPIRTLYALITTCKTLRSIILPHANPIARRRLIEDEPWYLPAGPFEFNNNKRPSALNTRMSESDRREMHGGQEVEWWASQWGAGGISQEEEEDADNKIPWFVYRKECSKSMSMWNRKRIWGICKQLDGLARKKGLL
ncbi:hypothetical protein M413DRAFT_447741 [Hebeloma cylindrosporum]|uniref:F-box domain-containing protein n=1 Tax=Hebeloma cylindrosporum TaxID=76867 RepID=A0A0C2YBY8_HEBCY|nr:hypothetical protein M413DRAFT_447741 [Hebeloma cylindrosporum h7]